MKKIILPFALMLPIASFAQGASDVVAPDPSQSALPTIAAEVAKSSGKITVEIATKELIPAQTTSTDKLNLFDAKIAVVDVESIFEHSVAIKDIKVEINKISDKIQSEMALKEKELKKIEGELIAERGKIPEKEFDERVAQFNKKVSAVQQLLQKRKSALEQAHSDAVTAVHCSTVDIISEMAKEKGFNMVLPSTQVIYVDSSLNITLEVITKLNDQLKSIDIQYDEIEAE